MGANIKERYMQHREGCLFLQDQKARTDLHALLAGLLPIAVIVTAALVLANHFTKPDLEQQVVTQNMAEVTPLSNVQSVYEIEDLYNKYSEFLKKLAFAESTNNPFAESDYSTAKGLYQFIDGTWESLVRKYGSDYNIAIDDRFDPEAQTIIALYALRDNDRILRNLLDREPSDGERYAAWHFGMTGALKMFEFAHYNTPAHKVLPSAAKANPSVFYNKEGRARNVRQVLDVVEAKINTTQSKSYQLADGR